MKGAKLEWLNGDLQSKLFYRAGFNLKFLEIRTNFKHVKLSILLDSVSTRAAHAREAAQDLKL